ncbi:MAG TPA: hypothetical protein VFV34_06030 [Blastocatellia bacterium]|nr:hypothetical protein [Blastocatellia bacterium]
MRKLAFVIALPLAFAACGDRSTNREIAEKAVDKFHAQYNERAFELICLQGAPEFKSDNTSLPYLQKAYDTMGRVVSSDVATGNVQNSKDEANITLVYVTTFEQGKTSETFAYRVKDRDAKLIFYEVAGPDLLKN